MIGSAMPVMTSARSTPIVVTSADPISAPTEIPMLAMTSSTANTAPRDGLDTPRWRSVIPETSRSALPSP